MEFENFSAALSLSQKKNIKKKSRLLHRLLIAQRYSCLFPVVSGVMEVVQWVPNFAFCN